MPAKFVVVSAHFAMQAGRYPQGELLAQLTSPVVDTSTGLVYDASIQVKTLDATGGAAHSLIANDDPLVHPQGTAWVIWFVTNGIRSTPVPYNIAAAGPSTVDLSTLFPVVVATGAEQIGSAWRGAYSALVQYSFGQLVSYGGNTWIYVATTPTIGNAPTVGSAYWQLFAAGGIGPGPGPGPGGPAFDTNPGDVRPLIAGASGTLGSSALVPSSDHQHPTTGVLRDQANALAEIALGGATPQANARANLVVLADQVNALAEIAARGATAQHNAAVNLGLAQLSNNTPAATSLVAGSPGVSTTGVSRDDHTHFDSGGAGPGPAGPSGISGIANDPTDIIPATLVIVGPRSMTCTLTAPTTLTITDGVNFFYNTDVGRTISGAGIPAGMTIASVAASPGTVATATPSSPGFTSGAGVAVALTGGSVTMKVTTGEFLLNSATNPLAEIKANGPAAQNAAQANLGIAAGSSGGFVFAAFGNGTTGLMNDNGVTDNTPYLKTLEATAASGGGAIVVLPAGNFGCNFTTTSPNVTWLGAGETLPGGSATQLVGLNSAAGTQASVFHVTQGHTSLWNLAVLGGYFGRDAIVATTYRADVALIIDGPDFFGFNITPLGGALVAMLETTNSKRAKYIGCRAGQPQGITLGSGHTVYYVKRTIAGTIGTATPVGEPHPVSTFTITDANTFATSRSMVGNITAGPTSATSTFTITDGTHTFTAPDVGLGMSGPGVPLGTYVLSVTSTTVAVLSQSCNNATGVTLSELTTPSDVGKQVSSQPTGSTGYITPGTYIAYLISPTVAVLSQHCAAGAVTGGITEYDSSCGWFYGGDTIIIGSVLNYGTKRFGAFGQMSGVHLTFTGSSGCHNVIFEAGATYHAGVLYADSSPSPADGSPSALLVHTQPIGGPGTSTHPANVCITNFQAFQNTAGNNQPMYIENDTISGLVIVGGILHAAVGQQFTALMSETWGAGSVAQIQSFFINETGALAVSSGQPVIFYSGPPASSPYSGLAWGQSAANISINYAGNYYGMMQTLVNNGSTSAGVALAQGAAPTAGTLYQNLTGAPMFLFGQATMGSGATDNVSVLITPTGAAPFITLQTLAPHAASAVVGYQATVPPGWWYKVTTVGSSTTLGSLYSFA